MKNEINIYIPIYLNIIQDKLGIICPSFLGNNMESTEDYNQIAKAQAYVDIHMNHGNSIDSSQLIHKYGMDSNVASKMLRDFENRRSSTVNNRPLPMKPKQLPSKPLPTYNKVMNNNNYDDIKEDINVDNNDNSNDNNINTELPLGWAKLRDKDGFFYFNVVSEERRRTRPTEDDAVNELYEPPKPIIKNKYKNNDKINGNHHYSKSNISNNRNHNNINNKKHNKLDRSLTSKQLLNTETTVLHSFKPKKPANINEFNNDEARRISQGSTVFMQVLEQSNQKKMQSDLSKQTTWDGLFAAVAQNAPIMDHFLIFRAMRSVAENLFNENDKYRCLYVDNKKVQQRILSRVGGYEYLRGLGFREIDNRRLQCDKPNFDIVSAAIQSVNKKIKALTNNENNNKKPIKKSNKNNKRKKNINNYNRNIKKNRNSNGFETMKVQRKYNIPNRSIKPKKPMNSYSKSYYGSKTMKPVKHGVYTNKIHKPTDVTHQFNNVGLLNGFGDATNAIQFGNNNYSQSSRQFKDPKTQYQQQYKQIQSARQFKKLPPKPNKIMPSIPKYSDQDSDDEKAELLVRTPQNNGDHFMNNNNNNNNHNNNSNHNNRALPPNPNNNNNFSSFFRNENFSSKHHLINNKPLPPNKPKILNSKSKSKQKIIKHKPLPKNKPLPHINKDRDNITRLRNGSKYGRKKRKRSIFDVLIPNRAPKKPLPIRSISPPNKRNKKKKKGKHKRKISKQTPINETNVEDAVDQAFDIRSVMSYDDMDLARLDIESNMDEDVESLFNYDNNKSHNNKFNNNHNNNIFNRDEYKFDAIDEMKENERQSFSLSQKKNKKWNDINDRNKMNNKNIRFGYNQNNNISIPKNNKFNNNNNSIKSRSYNNSNNNNKRDLQMKPQKRFHKSEGIIVMDPKIKQMADEMNETKSNKKKLRRKSKQLRRSIGKMFKKNKKDDDVFTLDQLKALANAPKNDEINDSDFVNSEISSPRARNNLINELEREIECKFDDGVIVRFDAPIGITSLQFIERALIKRGLNTHNKNEFNLCIEDPSPLSDSDMIITLQDNAYPIRQLPRMKQTLNLNDPKYLIKYNHDEYT